ncbi:MAG: M14 family metallopeptidase, partial [Alphaproteobacteria bacterium]
MSALRFFSASYGEARKKFLDACKQAGAQVETLQNPNANGPLDVPLYTDVARIGPETPKRLLILVSGTHGNEGFCGSAVQTGLLRGDIHERLPAETALLMIHAVNPCGFAHVRRVNEDNVDLNRNFVDHDAPHPENPAYEEVHGFICPPDLMARKEHYDAQAYRYLEEHGLEAFQAAVTGGQYTHEDGLFYGGRAPTWSNRTFTELVKRHAQGLEAAALIDFHTGLGPYGHGEPIGQGGPEVRAVAEDWFGDVRYPVDGSSVSAPIRGDLVSAFLGLAGAERRAGVAYEFGTREMLYVLEGLRADNWL